MRIVNLDQTTLYIDCQIKVSSHNHFKKSCAFFNLNHLIIKSYQIMCSL